MLILVEDQLNSYATDSEGRGYNNYFSCTTRSEGGSCLRIKTKFKTQPQSDQDTNGHKENAAAFLIK